MGHQPRPRIGREGSDTSLTKVSAPNLLSELGSVWPHCPLPGFCRSPLQLTCCSQGMRTQLESANSLIWPFSPADPTQPALLIRTASTPGPSVPSTPWSRISPVHLHLRTQEPYSAPPLRAPGNLCSSHPPLQCPGPAPQVRVGVRVRVRVGSLLTSW